MTRKSEKYQLDFFRFVDKTNKPPLRIPGKRGRNKQKLYPSFVNAYGKIPVERITPQMVEKFLSQICSDSSANGAHSHIKAMFNWAMRMQIVDMRNPVDPIDRRKIIKNDEITQLNKLKRFRDTFSQWLNQLLKLLLAKV